MRSAIMILGCTALLGVSSPLLAQAPKAMPQGAPAMGTPGGPPGGVVAPGQKKPLPAAKGDRWTRLLNAAGVMAREGMEVGRISATERKQIDDYIAGLQRFIAGARQGGVTEAEEDQVDNGVASMFRQIALYIAN